MAYKSKYTSAEIENKLDVVYNNYFNPVVPDEPVEPEPLPLGVFIQHTSGWLFTAEEWTAKGFPNEEANGVAVSTEECAFVIAKDGVSDSMMWSSDIKNAVDGLEIVTSEREAKKDYNGKTNTQLMLATDKSGAGYSCDNFAFPNGQKGYLPALGEWYIAYQNKSAIEAVITLIGGTALYSGAKPYWSSTQYAANLAYSQSWNNGGAGTNYKNNTYYVRAFTILKPEDIPSVEPTTL